MDAPRTRSENRAVRGYGFQGDSKRTPNGFRDNRNPGRVGEGRGKQLQNPRDVVDWDSYLAQYLPDEYYGWALMHAQQLYRRQPKRDRQVPDPADVLARMQAAGHTRAQIEESGP